jgi:subtilisin family serine protease
VTLGARPALAFLLALVLAIGTLPAAAVGSSPPAPDLQRQVLVLVRLPPPHYRPGGGSAEGYGDAMARKQRQRLAERIARSNGLTLVEDWPMPMIGLDCFIMAVPDDRSPEVVAKVLARSPDVEWSEPMRLYHGLSEARPHNDPLFPAQPVASAWRLADLHRLATGKDVLVAVIDSAVERGHPDLAGQVAVSQDFTNGPPRPAEQHGTAVAGLIAARADNGLGIVGVAPGARLMALRACRQAAAGPGASPPTTCDSLALAKAITFAIQDRAEVINLSLAGPPSPLLAKLLGVATARGVSVVSAYDKALPEGGFPASQPGVIAVSDESLAAPLRGVYIAPGRDVPTTEPGGRWFLVSGSSYAAAQVSGLMALARERRRSSSGRLQPVSTRTDGGRVDACATVLAKSDHCDCNCVFGREKVAQSRP